MSTIQDYAVILNNTLKHIAPKTFEQELRKEFYDYMHKIEHGERVYSDTGVAGLGMAEIIPDGAIGASDAPIEGFSKNYVQMHFTKKVRLTFQSNFFLFEASAKKIKADIKKKVINGRNSITQAKNYLAQSLLANGWTSSFVWVPNNNIGNTVTINTVTADGTTYWNTTKAREDGGPSWSNIITSGGVPSPRFSYESLLSARRQHRLKKDGRGNPYMSHLDTLLVRDGSNAHQLAMTIQKTIDKGLAPSQTNIYNNAPATDTFKIVTVAPYGGLGLTDQMWFMFDSKMIDADGGFLYIESLDTREENAFVDLAGNQDLILNFNSLCVMGASDLRPWMASAGDETTTA